MWVARGSGVDLIGEGLPNWIMAITGVLTLGAAVAAALFARAAAKHAGAQVRESEKQTTEAHRQAELADVQASLARRTLRAQTLEAQRQNEAAHRAERRTLEARLDERMPFVIARAKLNYSNLFALSSGEDIWQTVTEQARIPPRSAPTFSQEVIVTFENVSAVPARIDIIDAAHGEFSGLPLGEPLVVSPGAEAQQIWTRTIAGNLLFSEGATEDPSIWLFNIRFWVRDLAMLARDEYAFNGSLRHFSIDGSQLIVDPNVRDSWPAGQNIAGLFPDRVYERLDAEGKFMTAPGDSSSPSELDDPASKQERGER